MNAPLSRLAVAAALIAVAIPGPLSAQFQSQGAKFLSAVKDGKGNDVIQMVQAAGSTIVNVHDDKTGDTALHITVTRGDTPFTVYLLQNKADMNAKDRAGNTPLMDAVSAGQAGMAELLLKIGANTNLANNSGETPLIRAVQRRDLSLVRDLLGSGANPDQTDSIAGRSARDYAKLDTRTPALARLFDATPKGGTAKSVAGPKL